VLITTVLNYANKQSANLVDITYLFENGALIDFTSDELISLLKALFADSEKREKAIERIERGLQQ
jgi:prophage maintenance system killer protein